MSMCILAKFEWSICENHYIQIYIYIYIDKKCEQPTIETAGCKEHRANKEFFHFICSRSYTS